MRRIRALFLGVVAAVTTATAAAAAVSDYGESVFSFTLDDAVQYDDVFDIKNKTDDWNYSIEKSVLSKDSDDKALVVSGYSTNDSRIEFSTLQSPYNALSALDCGENGSFVLSFDFATSDLCVPIRIDISRNLLWKDSALKEEMLSQQVFELTKDGSIKVFFDEITSAEIASALGSPICENEWYKLQIVFNADNQIGVLLNGSVVRQMSAMTGFKGTSLRGLSTFLRIYSNGTKSSEISAEDAKSTARYFDNIEYRVIKNRKITELEDEYPLSIGFSGENISLSKGGNMTVTPNISSHYGAERVEYYINGVKEYVSKTKPFALDMSAYGVGDFALKAVVFDKNGESASAEVAVSVQMEFETELWSHDFADFTTGASPITQYITAANQRGYAKADEIDDEHGTSLLIGMGDKPNEVDGAGAIANFYNPAPTKNIVFRSEFYVSEKAGENYRITFKQTGSTELEAVYIGSVIKCGTATAEYETGKWYELKIDVNFTDKKYSVYIDNVLLAADRPIENMQELNVIRCYGPAFKGPTFIALDNVSISQKYRYGISSVTDSKGNTTVDYDTEELYVYLTTDISGITAEQLEITSSEDTALIKEAEFYADDGCIKVTLGSRLLPDTQYYVRLTKSVSIDGTAEVGEKAEKPFKTKNTPVSVEISEMGENKVKYSLQNSGGAQTVYIIITVWEGNAYKDMIIKEVSADENSQSDGTIDISGTVRGDTIRVTAWSSITYPRVVTNRIYSKKF